MAVTVALIAASVAVISVPFLLDANWRNSKRTPAASALGVPDLLPRAGPAVRDALPEPAGPARARPPSQSPTASPTPTPTESTPATVTVDRFAQFESVLDAGLANGEIRDDVATDMRNLLNNIDRSDAQSANQQLAALQRKIDDRQREGGLSAAAAERLRRVLSAEA